jgi:WD40 repeat protein
MKLISNKYLASCAADTSILIWVISSGQVYRNLSGHTDAVYSIQLLANTSQLASASRDGTIKIWDWLNAVCIKNLAIGSLYPNVLQLLTDGSLAAGFSDYKIRTFNITIISNIAQITNFTGHTGLITSIQNVSSTTIISSSMDGCIILWDMPSSSITNKTFVSSNGTYFLTYLQTNKLVTGYSEIKMYDSALVLSANVSTSTNIYSGSQIAFPTGICIYFFYFSPRITLVRIKIFEKRSKFYSFKWKLSWLLQ